MKNYPLYEHRLHDTLKDHLAFCDEQFGARPAFLYAKGKEDVTVTYEQFKYCFESADMSLLQSKCANNKYGGIRYMIVKLRTVLPTWYEKVAETITDSNGNKYDKISLQRSVADYKVYAKDFRKMIKEIDIDFPK